MGSYAHFKGERIRCKMIINVTRSLMPPYEEYCAEIKDLWDSRWLTNMGAKHQKLKQELARYVDAKNLALLVNGHMAIELSLQALGLTGEVITTPFTFASTTMAIVRSGLTPVFCDVDPVTLTVNPAKIEPLITKRTSAILPVHVYGNVCDVESIDRIAQKHGLKVLYDAAHMVGVRYKGRGMGAFGDAACFSFHATKVFHTIEGGAACFRETSGCERMMQLKQYGFNAEKSVELLGCNAKMNEFSAAMGLCNLRHLDAEIKKRGQIVERYREHLEGIPGLRLKVIQAEVEPNHAYFPVLFEKAVFGASRDEVQEALKENGIFPRKYFYPLTSSFACFDKCFDPEQTPTALRSSRQVLCLPLCADFPFEEVDRICEIILKCGRNAL